MTDKPRIRVPARMARTHDSYQNFAARVGLGTENLMSASTYGFNPISRNRTLLEWMYRGSWLVGQAVDVVADDMTRAGVEITSTLGPDEIAKIQKALADLVVWERLNDATKWSRLYGGAIAVLLVEGQALSTPLRTKTVRQGQFKGLAVLDRWMVNPSVNNVVTDLGPDLGQPKFYSVVADGLPLSRQKIHHSRVIRIEGADLPYWQKMSENGWGLSVIERLYDRMVAFDSTTQGVAQLVFKAHLRTIKVEKLREIIAAGGKAMEGLSAQMDFIRLMQTNEGLTLLDASDAMETHSFAFSGLSDVLLQFGQQLSGALQIPLVRLFGQSPAGLNSTGESDLKTYHDNIARQQERQLRRGVGVILDLTARSELGRELPEGSNFKFVSLTQLSEKERADIAKTTTDAVCAAEEQGIVTKAVALKELRQSSADTGVWSNITDQDITDAENEPVPDPNEPELQGDLAGDLDLKDTKVGKGKAPKGEKKPEPTKDVAPSFSLHGLPIVIETAKGEIRRGHGWSVTMPEHYGFIADTYGADGDEVDAFFGPTPESDRVWVIDQANPDTGAFDEHKVMLGFASQAEALTCYMRAYDDGRVLERAQAVTEMTLADLKAWLAAGRAETAIAKAA